MGEEPEIVNAEELAAFAKEAASKMREPDLKFDDWNAAYFIEASPLIDYLDSLTELKGQKINAVYSMGCIFNRDYIIEGEDKYLNLDEPVVVVIGNTQFEVWFYTDSRVKIGINTLTLKEK